jgi:hypothetical protein
MKNIADKRGVGGDMFGAKAMRGERSEAIPFNGKLQASEILTKAPK